MGSVESLERLKFHNISYHEIKAIKNRVDVRIYGAFRFKSALHFEFSTYVRVESSSYSAIVKPTNSRKKSLNNLFLDVRAVCQQEEKNYKRNEVINSVLKTLAKGN